MLWAASASGAGLLASAFALSEWVGEREQRTRPPDRASASGSRRPPALTRRGLRPRRARRRSTPSRGWRASPIEAMAVSRGAVELRGWVPSRSSADPRRPHGPRRPRHRERDQQPAGARRGRSPLARPAPGDRPERMTAPLAPQYNPSAIESAALRLVAGARTCSRPSARARRPAGEPYVIMMPPPNVTAVLHMGHGLNNTVQDVLVRFERMRGRRALWVPGTDHAGIATQNVVERLLAKEGLTRFDLGPRGVRGAGLGLRARRPAARSSSSSRRSAARADWSRTYFTLDDGALARRARGRSCGCTRRG